MHRIHYGFEIPYSPMENIGPKFSRFIMDDSKLGFLGVGLRLYFQDFPISQRNFRIFECCSVLCITQFFSNLGEKKMEIFLNVRLNCILKLLTIH